MNWFFSHHLQSPPCILAILALSHGSSTQIFTPIYLWKLPSLLLRYFLEFLADLFSSFLVEHHMSCYLYPVSAPILAIILIAACVLQNYYVPGFAFKISCIISSFLARTLKSNLKGLEWPISHSYKEHWPLLQGIN